jgi:tripartite ATP-independent transporter DctM subunit
VLGSVTTLSIGALFLAGLVPAATIAVCLMLVVYARSRLLGLKRSERAGIGRVGSAALSAVLPLLMPVVLFGGILSGVGTPTEVSSLAVVYGLVLAILVYRELNLRALLRVVSDGAAMSGMILFIIAMASLFSRALTLADLPQGLTAAMVPLPSWVFMLVTVVLLLVMGALLEGIAALLIFAPLLVPVAGHLGLNPLHYGIVMVIAMGIGSFAPPIGIGLYVACAVCKTPLDKAMRPMWLYVGVLVAGLLLVAFVPWLTLAVPHAVHLSTR